MNNTIQRIYDTLTKKWNVKPEEAREFIADLKEEKQEQKVESRKSDQSKPKRILTAEVIAELKKTDAGRKILIDAPTYQKEELQKIIDDYLQVNK